jgi:3-dehydroquinate dehydratase / shikimate dehydrogenase
MGKICVSVCAKTADELIEKIKRAEEFADVIEIRFDCLDDDEEILKFLKSPAGEIIEIATYRPLEQGGQKQLSLEDRARFWNGDLFPKRFFGLISTSPDLHFVDFELDILEKKLTCERFNTIGSFHDFIESPPNLAEIYERLKNTISDIIKIAVQADDITDTIPIWKLLKRAKSENQEIIPIAMGEAGKWTRILGLAHGAFLTFASLDSESATAPGQISAKDLHSVYRVKELDKNTDVYGILGSNTSVSMSPYIHNFAFKYHNLNAVFVPLQVHDLDAFITRMVKAETREIELNFKGFAVTIPHKQTIIKHLDFIDETARKIGAVNTVKIIDGKLHGFNTDAHGFIEPLKSIYNDLKGARVLILGAGGASKACEYALEKEGAEVTVFGRSDILNFKLQTPNFVAFDIIVNATPLGMRGKAEGETPIYAEQMKNAKLVYDLVYTPFETKFLQEADKVFVPKIGGMAMLVAQAIEQQEIWTGLSAPMREISRIVARRLE